MKRFSVSMLGAYIGLLVFISAPYAERRQPTEMENQTYLPIVQLWLSGNWEKVKDLGDNIQIAQKITEIDYCCIDQDEDRHIHIVDIQFHAKYYDRDRMIEEKDMAQRILFKCADGRIVDYEPMPAYRLEEWT